MSPSPLLLREDLATQASPLISQKVTLRSAEAKGFPKHTELFAAARTQTQDGTLHGVGAQKVFGDEGMDEGLQFNRPHWEDQI